MVSKQGRIVLVEHRSGESEKWAMEELVSRYISPDKIYDLLKWKQRQWNRGQEVELKNIMTLIYDRKWWYKNKDGQMKVLKSWEF